MRLRNKSDEKYEGGRRPRRRITERLSAGLDRVVYFFSPVRGMRRMAARSLARYWDMFSAYDGARNDRLKSGWTAGSESADQALLPELDTLRDRSRALNRNDSHAAGVTQTVTSNVIGTGINPQSRIDGEDLGIDEETVSAFQKKAEKVWKHWSTFADAQDVQTISEIQNLIERQILESGEVIVLPLRLRDPHRPYMLALEIIEADRLSTPWELRGAGNVRDGVELGDMGQPIGYWIRKTHPGDITVSNGSRISSDNSKANYVYVPARNRFGDRNIYHLFWKLRPGQTRGQPFFAPVIRMFRDLGQYSEAELVGARVAACFSAFITEPDPVTGLVNSTESVTYKGKTRRKERVEPGMIQRLPMGSQVFTVNPSRSGTNFDAFVERALRGIASGLGLPYELIGKDFSKTNFSSARAAILEARRMFQQRQKFHVDRWLHPVYQALIEEAFLAGEFMDISGVADFVERKEEWTSARWIPQGWAWVDPVREVQAATIAIQNGLSTRADEAAAQGKDWEEIDEQQKRELDSREEKGLSTTTGSSGISSDGNDGRVVSSGKDEEGNDLPSAESSVSISIDDLADALNREEELEANAVSE